MCGAQCCANGDIAYHREYLDELDLTLVANLLKILIEMSTLANSLFCVRKDCYCIIN